MPQNYRSALMTYIQREALPIEKYGHQPRLYALTQLVGQGHTYDDEIVFAAAWLHDLGVFTGHRPEDPDELARWDNVIYAVAKAPAILQDAGFPTDKIAAVLETIRTHQPNAVPTTLEAIILRDADMLEQLGAIGILRQVCKVGRDTRFSTFTEVMNSLHRALADLPAKIQLETTRELAVDKIQILKSFINAVQLESYDSLF